MRRNARELAVGVLLGTMIVLMAPAQANHQLNHLEPPVATHDHDPYWYDFNDAGCNWACYSNSKLDDRMKDALNNPLPPYNQKGWTALGLTDAIFQAHSSGNGQCHEGGLGADCSHHRTNMVTFDYDCVVYWPDLSVFPNSAHPTPGASCPGASNSWGAATRVSYLEHFSAQYGWHRSIVGSHIYLKPQSAKTWTYTTGCCTTGLDVWAWLEHEFGHALGHLGHWNESDNTLCPDDVNNTVRLTMCQGILGWKQRTPELRDRNAMDFSYPD